MCTSTVNYDKIGLNLNLYKCETVTSINFININWRNTNYLYVYITMFML